MILRRARLGANLEVGDDADLGEAWHVGRVNEIDMGETMTSISNVIRIGIDLFDGVQRHACRSIANHVKVQLVADVMQG